MGDEPLKPGEYRTRAEIQTLFGGGQTAGILPSNKKVGDPKQGSVLIFADHKNGKKSGYYDGWLPESENDNAIFEYTGHGQGDQNLEPRTGVGNRAILNHIKDNRALRVFVADGTVKGTNTKYQRYLGKFQIDQAVPYTYRQAPNEAKKMREVIVFRLHPEDDLEPLAQDSVPQLSEPETLLVPATTPKSKLVEAESFKIYSASKSATQQTEVKFKEASLSDEFKALLESHEHTVKRFQIRTSGLSSSLLSDLYDTDDHVLYEAKGESSREAIRMAIGQLMDYRRYANPPNPTLAVLLPNEPQSDLQNLLKSVDIKIVYRHEGGFIGWPVTPED